MQTSDALPPSSAGKSTARLVAQGAALFMAMRWSLRAIGLVSTMVLAHLLVPADFGLVAIATSLIAILNTFTDLGSRSATIRQTHVSQAFLDTVLTLQLLRGCVIAFIILVSSLVLPVLMKDGRLAAVLACLALEPLISAFLNPRMALFEGRLNFGPEAVLQISAKVLATGLTITLALWQRSYWALVAGTLMASSVKVVISYVLAPQVPRLGLSEWRTLFRFSGWVTMASFLDSLATGFDQLIVGGFLNVRAAGLYNVGAGLASMPLSEFLPVVTRALLPGLVKFKDDAAKLRQISLDVVGFLAGLSLPIGIGFAFVAPEFVDAFYGAKWTDAILIVQVISVSAALGSVGGAVASAMAFALGRTDLIFHRSALTICLRLPPFVAGIWLYGLTGAFVGYFIGSVAALLSNLMILHRSLSISYGELARRLVRPIIAVLFMTAGLGGLGLFLPVPQNPAMDVVLLFTKTLVGAAAYCAARLAMWRITGRPELLDTKAVAVLNLAAARFRLGIGRFSKLSG